MIKFSKPILFLLLTISIFILGIILSDIINDGLKKGKSLVFEIFQIVSLIISSGVFYMKLVEIRKK